MNERLTAFELSVKSLHLWRRVVNQITTQMSARPAAQQSAAHFHHDACLTLDLTNFLLGRVSMDEVCQYCVLTAFAPMHARQMSVYVVGTDSLFRVVGSFGMGDGLEALHKYSCLEEPHVGEQLHHGRPLANFPLVGMRPEQHLNIPELRDGTQVLWPLTTSNRLIGVVHVRFSSAPDAKAASEAMQAIAGPIALSLDMGVDPVGITPSTNGHGPGQAILTHPSMLGQVATQTTPLSVVRWGEGSTEATKALPSAQDLSSRQLRVLALMAKGMTNGQIARVLAFSESTIRQETMAIYRTLQVKGRAEAVDYGRSHGLIPAQV
jgi:DNA-binding CsgD family transcriptional regulator